MNVGTEEMFKILLIYYLPLIKVIFTCVGVLTLCKGKMFYSFENTFKN